MLTQYVIDCPEDTFALFPILNWMYVIQFNPCSKWMNMN